MDSVKSRAVCRVAANGSVQLWDGVNTGDTFNDGVSAGAGLRAMRLDVSTQLVAHYLEIFTGEVSGPATLAIWSHDSTNNQPDAPLASGSWTLAELNQWQGAALDQRLPMSPGETYWVVWEQVSGAQAPRGDAGVSVEYFGSMNGGATWNGPFNGFEKYKVCGGGGCP
jgi:hypothetical protein